MTAIRSGRVKQILATSVGVKLECWRKIPRQSDLDEGPDICSITSVFEVYQRTRGAVPESLSLRVFLRVRRVNPTTSSKLQISETQLERLQRHSPLSLSFDDTFMGCNLITGTSRMRVFPPAHFRRPELTRLQNENTICVVLVKTASGRAMQ
ncbi:hypothetical protein PM082_017642 [Marasmius tenuissimus]|nr:hypothetical protein PM082_017642 [Marasmius tenuissimus]